MNTHRLARLVILLLLLGPAALPAQESGTTPPASPSQGAQQPSIGELRERAAGHENRSEFSAAGDDYLALVTAEPTRADWVLAAGRCLGLAGRYNDALDLLTQKRATFPGLLEIPALLAKTYLLRVERDAGVLDPALDYATAADLATEVLQLDPDHEDARLILAQARYGQGDSEAALAAANEAVRRHPQRPGAHILVGRAAYDQFVQFKRLLEQKDLGAAAKEPLLVALDAARKQAVDSLRRAAELDLERPFPHIMLGQIAALERDNEAALAEWRKALAIDPDAHVDHSWITERTTPDQRAAFYRDVRSRYTAQPRAEAARAATLLFYEGLALYQGSQWQAARELFQMSRAQNEHYVNADYYGAMCAWRLNDHDGAETLAANYAAASAVGFADVLRALAPEARSEVADVVRFLADRAFKENRLDHSRDLNHVIACLLDSADAWNNYAFLCRETKQFDDAFAGYQHALEKEPDSPQLWNDAAVILHFHQPTPANLARARTMYEHALALADQQLADAASSALVRDRAARAKEDARRNLLEMPK